MLNALIQALTIAPTENCKRLYLAFLLLPLPPFLILVLSLKGKHDQAIFLLKKQANKQAHRYREQTDGYQRQGIVGVQNG